MNWLGVARDINPIFDKATIKMAAGQGLFCTPNNKWPDDLRQKEKMVMILKNKKKSLFLLAGLVLMLVLVACGDAADPEDNEAPPAQNGAADDGAVVEPTDDEGEGLVGISMPSLSLERWERDGTQIEADLQALGFGTHLQFAQDDVATQISQIENMITQGVDILVIAPIDGETLTAVLETAAAADIPVIAYDRLIMNSEHISYYVTFDNFLVGQTQGYFIVEALGLNDYEGPFNIELFAGAPDDNNARLFNEGAMSVLDPFIADGTLVVQSGQTDFNQIAIPGWSTAEATNRMDNLLSLNDNIDAVLSPNDSLALGIVASFQNLGLEVPVVTGQDADLANVLSILAGDQSMTVFKDTRILAATAAEMVQTILAGGTVNVNDTETYDNGVFVVPTYLVDVMTVTADNVREVLVDSGFYTAEALGLE